jgi:hypothetical protein
LRAIPEYSGLVRDCVDRYFDELSQDKRSDKSSKPLGKDDSPMVVQALRIPASVQKRIATLPRNQRAAWLRRVIAEAAQRELMNGGES